jgi:quinol monooxygenase YgiN
VVIATIRMTIPRKKRDEILKILRSIAEQCRLHSGCLGCHVYEEVQGDNAVMLEEMWSNEADLAKHLRSEEYGKVILVMEMALKPPEIRFNTISRSTGIETIEKARSPISRL